MRLIMFATVHGFGSSPLSYKVFIKKSPNDWTQSSEWSRNAWKKEQTEISLPLPPKCPKHGEILVPEEDFGFFFLCEHITVLQQL